MIPYHKYFKVSILAPLLTMILSALPTMISAAEAGDKYAEYLFKSGYYDEAFRRYQFLQYNANDSAKKNYYLYWMARSTLEDGKPAQAERQFKEIINVGTPAKLSSDEIYFQYLRSLYFQKKFYETAFEAESSSFFGSSPQVGEICAWSYINSGDWEKAADIFNQLTNPRIPAGRPNEKELNRYREIADLLNKRPDFRKKSPVTAGMLSAIFPGAGHAYAGNWDNAFGAFFLNAVFGGLTAYSIHKKEWIYAGFFGFIEAGWYTGNIVSAHQEAKFRNRAEETDYKLNLSVQFPFQLGNINKK